MLVGVRMRRDTDHGDVTVWEYRVGPDGKASLSVGDPRMAVSSVRLNAADNALIRMFGSSDEAALAPLGKDEERVLTPADGVDFILALLVRFGGNGTYSWMEPIKA